MTPNAAATLLFLVIAISVLANGGITARNAWGSTTSWRVCPKVIPTDRAASAWPAAIELMPDRSASQTNDAV